MKKNDLWSFKNLDSYFDPKIGLVYQEFGNNAFEIILCSANYEHLTEEDIVIPAKESDVQYSIVAHSDMLFPILKSDSKLNKKIGKVSDFAIEQIATLRNEIKNSDNTEIKFKIGSPIFYKDQIKDII